ADPVTFALGDQRCLEENVCGHALVLETLCELEGALDVLACRLVIALAAPAPGAPVEDLRAQAIAREARALSELKRLVEQRNRCRDARKLVAAHAEAEENVSAIDIGEALALDERASPREELDRLAHLADVLAGPGLDADQANLEIGRARD